MTTADAIAKCYADAPRLVWSPRVAPYTRQYADARDAIGQAYIGIARAAKRFDPKRDVKFITYAMWFIRAAVQAGLKTNATSVVCTPITKKGYKIEGPATFHTMYSDGDTIDLTDRDAAPVGESHEQRQYLEWLMNQLDCPRAIDILTKRHVGGMSLKTIGERYGISKERVRQILVATRGTLRKRAAKGLTEEA